MLQQTTVAAVTPFFERFIKRFPDWKSLAEAPAEEVLAHWAGLGYYARARNLQKCAQSVVEKGGFPRELSEILSLPGIGRYTAGAVASIAFDVAAPIVDANVARVLARVFALEGSLKNSENQQKLWQEAEILVQSGAKNGVTPSQLNPALMELGALVCTPKNPRCEVCPVEKWCAARRQNRQHELPQRAPRPLLTSVHDVCAFAFRENEAGKRELLDKA